ncbi:MAG TPA: HAMP domain-containing sensor histidine kinase [Cyclobacteriaceae bacterium]|nr:HAMP domain-containing sensor histidine kinase [Cyclobacteriaceae bacterium]
MMSNAKRMLDVLNALSTLYKLTTKDLHLSEINIDQTLRKVIDSQQGVAAGHNVTLHYSMDDPAPMVSDPDLLTELVKQVVQNGIYFRNSNVAGLVQVVAKIDEGLLHLDVLDDGDGIAPEIEANIFDIFFRGSEKSGGSGLGLYIARKICQLLGGSISFSREYDKTTFSIELPTKY